jgi:hypothetical protein
MLPDVFEGLLSHPLAPQRVGDELHIDVFGGRFMVGPLPGGVAVRTVAATTPVREERLKGLGGPRAGPMHSSFARTAYASGVSRRPFSGSSGAPRSMRTFAVRKPSHVSSRNSDSNRLFFMSSPTAAERSLRQSRRIQRLWNALRLWRASRAQGHPTSRRAESE